MALGGSTTGSVTEAGDRVLQATAARLRETLRISDFIACLGGDEFVAVLPETADPSAIDVRVPVDRDHGFRWKMITQSGGT